jgi:glycosyltransferase involved in cell wall biosynthesis
MSQNNTERLKKIGVAPEKLVYIPPGVDSYFFKNPSEKEIYDARIDASEDAGKFLVTYLGPPLLTRGVDTLLKALDYALHRFPNLKCRLRALFLLRIREGEYVIQRNKVIKLFDRFKHKEVVCVKSGFLSGSEIRAYMAASDLIVFPFKHVISDFPLGVVEAMSMGKLVISTRVDGMPELLEGKRGIIVDPGDFVNIGRIFAHFSQNRWEIGEYGKRARCYMLERPTWNHSTGKMLELLSDVLKTH